MVNFVRIDGNKEKINMATNLFDSKNARLETAFAAFLAYNVSGELVGLTILNTEGTNDFMFLDVYILKEFQGRGYGKEITLAMKELFSSYDELMIAQTRNYNAFANKILEGEGIFLLEHKVDKYYLLGDINKLTKEKLKKLIDHRYFGKDTKDICNIYKEDDYKVKVKI